MRPLIDAHVIPRPFWKLAKSAREAPKILSNSPGVFPKRAIVGVYDSAILCADCDGELGRLDQHAAQALLQNKPHDMSAGGRLYSRRYDHADPATFRRFMLSVLWRAAVSSHVFFKRVRLGAAEERVRHAMADPDMAALPELQCILGEFDDTNVPFLDPHATRENGARLWVVYADRFIFYVKVGAQPLAQPLASLCLEPGRPVMSVVRNWSRSKERSLVQSIARTHPLAFPPPEQTA